MKTIVIGVASSIACYKIIPLIKTLKENYKVEVILTKNTENLINPSKFEKVLNKKVYSEMFRAGWTYKEYKSAKESEHIGLADKADLFLIAPATANTVGKLANGIADDLLTTTALATKAPIIIAPAMNCHMWENQAVQDNLSKLKERGMQIIDPEFGDLACGYTGKGRLAKNSKIRKVIEDTFNRKERLKGKSVIVTAGGTVEEIDPVRVITNKSSGKMGIAIANEASMQGANVILIKANTSVEAIGNFKTVPVRSVNELLSQIKKHIKKADAIIHAAAVSDFATSKTDKKIKSGQLLNLELTPTTKILEKLKILNKKVKVVGFKAEYNVSNTTLNKRAKDLLKSSRANAIVANDVEKDRFGSDNNTIHIITENKIKKLKNSKKELAKDILALIK